MMTDRERFDRVVAERDEARARLTTAEQERDKLAHDVKYLRGQVQLNERLLIETVDRKLAAEARVEAAERALAQIRSYRRIPGRGMHSDMEEMRAIARAALACPPQQPPAWPGAGPDERDYSVETP